MYLFIYLFPKKGAWLYNSTELMTKLKRAQLKERIRRENNRRSSKTSIGLEKDKDNQEK